MCHAQGKSTVIDITDARRRYRAELEAALACAGGKTRKRTFTRMVQAVTEHRGAELTDPDEEILVWSDLHLGHANIIEYQDRPFLDVADQDAELWRAWERIDPDAVLVVVGDVAMGEAVCDATWERVRAAPGREKHLIIGNHDVTGPGEIRTRGFDHVWSVMVSAGSPPLVWTHYPLAEVPEGHVNVHGHRHGAPPGRSPHINVAIEQLEYEPVRLDRLRRLARALVEGHYPPGATTIERIAHLERNTDLWAVPTETAGVHTQSPTPIDWEAKFEAMKRTVFMSAGTGDAAPRAAEPEDDGEGKWRVDWDAVRRTEAWLKREWAAGRRGWKPRPGTYDILPSAVPEEVGNIGGVLLSRCAGYARAPDPRDVAAAVDADSPTREQWRALQTYLLEATAKEVRAACLAGEIDVRKLMRRVHEIIERDGMYGLRSVEQWLAR